MKKASGFVFCMAFILLGFSSFCGAVNFDSTNMMDSNKPGSFNTNRGSTESTNQGVTAGLYVAQPTVAIGPRTTYAGLPGGYLPCPKPEEIKCPDIYGNLADGTRATPSQNNAKCPMLCKIKRVVIPEWTNWPSKTPLPSKPIEVSSAFCPPGYIPSVGFEPGPEIIKTNVVTRAPFPVDTFAKMDKLKANYYKCTLTNDPQFFYQLPKVAAPNPSDISDSDCSDSNHTLDPWRAHFQSEYFNFITDPTTGKYIIRFKFSNGSYGLGQLDGVALPSSSDAQLADSTSEFYNRAFGRCIDSNKNIFLYDSRPTYHPYYNASSSVVSSNQISIGVYFMPTTQTGLAFAATLTLPIKLYSCESTKGYAYTDNTVMTAFVCSHPTPVPHKNNPINSSGKSGNVDPTTGQPLVAP